MKRTLYDVLQVGMDATHVRIAAAYAARRDALVHAVDDESQNELKLAQQALLVLSDPVQRAKYDETIKTQLAEDNSLIYYPTDSFGNLLARVLFLVLTMTAVASFVAYYYV